jgi:hypothetical protein
MKGRGNLSGVARIFGGILILALGSSGCAGLAGPPQPTALPSEYLPTAIALTVAAGRAASSAGQATSTPTSTSSASPPPTHLPPTFTPTPPLTSTQARPTATPTSAFRRPTPTLTPTPPIPLAEIQILNPGPASRVVSPIKVSAYLEPGAKGNVTFELLGEDGRLLARTIKTYYQGIWVHTNLEIEYEISAVAEAARLQISTRDAYGRITHLSSIELLLLSLGDPDLSPAGDLLEPIVLQQPRPNALIQGGRVSVSGLARTDSATPLIVEMFTQDGKPLGPARLVNMTESEYSGYSAFTAEIPYSIDAPTWVLVTVSELSSRIPGTTHLSSLEVYLSP